MAGQLKPRSRRGRGALTALVVTLAMLTPVPHVSASTPDGRADASSVAAKPKPKPKSFLQFVSKDGTAEVGALTSFTVTNAANGKSRVVQVLGQGVKTVTKVAVKPGTYTLTTERSTYNGATFSVSSLTPSDARVVVAKPKKKNVVATVTFSLTKVAAPVTFALRSSTPDSVILDWTGPADVQTYDLRRTSGYAAAASVTDGTAVALSSPTALSVTDTGLAPGSTYTYTLFTTLNGGAALAPISVTAATPTPDGSEASFSVVPNTVVATSAAEVQAMPLGDGLVSVVLSSAMTRASAARVARPATQPWLREASPDCVVGQPFLLPSDVAGPDAFYGVVESCGSAAATERGSRRRDGQSAVIDTDQPISAVLASLEASDERTECVPIGEDDLQGDLSELSCEPGVDTDGDGLDDDEERDLGTDPGVADTDDDALSDGDEVDQYDTDPLRIDTDRDSVEDGEEIEAESDPLVKDTDGDGMFDGEEIFGALSDPTSIDSDNDGVHDLVEVEAGSDPDDATSKPSSTVRVDKDGDRLTDPREDINLSDVAKVDTDADGLDDYVEVTTWATDPDDTDSDGDGIPDGVEVQQGSEPQDNTSPSTSMVATARRDLPLASFSCRSSKSAKVDLRGAMPTEQSFSFKQSGTRFEYSFAFVRGFSVNPLIDLKGASSCNLRVSSGSIPVVTAPIPIYLTVDGTATANSNGSFLSNGPYIAANVGFRGSGFAEVGFRCTGIFSCGPTFNQSQNFQPVKDFTFRQPVIDIKGHFDLATTISVGVNVGLENSFSGAKAAFAGSVTPINANFDLASNGKKTCAKFNSNGSANLSYYASAWILNKGYSIGAGNTLFSTNFGQTSQNIGKC